MSLDRLVLKCQPLLEIMVEACHTANVYSVLSTGVQEVKLLRFEGVVRVSKNKHLKIVMSIVEVDQQLQGVRSVPLKLVVVEGYPEAETAIRKPEEMMAG